MIEAHMSNYKLRAKIILPYIFICTLSFYSYFDFHWAPEKKLFSLWKWNEILNGTVCHTNTIDLNSIVFLWNLVVCKRTRDRIFASIKLLLSRRYINSNKSNNEKPQTIRLIGFVRDVCVESRMYCVRCVVFSVYSQNQIRMDGSIDRKWNSNKRIVTNKKPPRINVCLCVFCRFVMRKRINDYLCAAWMGSF